MAGVNKVIIIGNLGRDPEIKYTQGNVPVANFTVATTENWKDKQSGEWNEKTEWHRIVAWRHLAERCERFLRKGKQVYVEGRLETRKWEDRDGNTRYTTEIIARELQMLGRRDQDEGGGYGGGKREAAGNSSDGGFTPPPSPEASNNTNDEDDLPF